MNSLFRSALPLAMMVLLSLSVLAKADPVTFDSPVQPLEPALKSAAAAGHLNLVANDNLLTGKMAPPLKGPLEPRDALRRLLAGSGLTVTIIGNSAIVTRQTSDVNLGPVKVVGVLPAGLNGSTDPTATEGTGSYTTELTTVGSKAPLSLRQTPQSVSVVTQQEIIDRSLFDSNQVLSQMPGVSLIAQNGVTDTIVSRGFQVNSYQIDGGAPIIGNTATYPGNNWPFQPYGSAVITPLYDTAEYDHVELIRGSDGMWSGQGSPSGTINLVRKRPLDHVQIIGELSAGSWNNFRELADITGPIAWDGRLRARLVAENQDNDYFYKTASNKRELIYGIIEADLTPSTLVTVGGSRTWIDATPISGLPRYSDGTDLRLSRSTCLCATWAKDYATNTEGFLKIEQKIGSDWTAALNGTTTHNTTAPYNGSVTGTVNPVTLLGPALGGGGGWFGGAYQHSLEATGTGRFQLLGHEQTLLFGADSMWLYQTQSNQTSNFTNLHYTPVNVFNFDPDLYAKPAANAVVPEHYALDGQQVMAFATLRFTPVDRVHFIGGFSWQSFDPQLGYSLPSHIVPYGSVTIDATENLSPYFSYTSIYESNYGQHYGPPPLASTTTVSNGIHVQTNGTILPQDPSSLLPPLTGNENEIGIKGEFFGKKLRSSVAAYRIKQNNEPAWDTRWPYYPGQCCFYTIGDIESEGLDFEISGQLQPGLQVETSYNYNLTRQQQPLVSVPVYKFNGTSYVATPGPGNGWGPSPGQPNYTQAPRHQFKVWLNWQPEFSGLLPVTWSRGLSIGAGVNGQSGTFTTGSACPSPLDIDPTSGFCKVASVSYKFTQGFYAVFSARIGYQLNSQWSAQLNITNLFDRTYYVTPGSSSGGNFYGEPRSAIFTLRAKY